MGEKSETITISARIPKELYEKLTKKMKKDGFLNISDLLRYLIRYYIQYISTVYEPIEVSVK